MSEPSAACLDCGEPYWSMGLDLVLPDQQWRVLCPEGGILCPSCICNRAESLGGTCVMAWIDNVDYSKPYTRRNPA